MVEINNIKYEIIKNEKDAFSEDIVSECLTDYYYAYDYIVGDWAYGKLRLKGFNEKSNKDYKTLNDCKRIDDYLENSCAYGCKYFILKKVER
jgi:uncharacterized protein YutD